MNKILVVAAHPDDEVLGCGGTLRMHVQQGDQVDVLFMTDGEAARTGVDAYKAINRQQCALNAAKILGLNSVNFLKFPDNAMDQISLLSIVKELEKEISKIQPQTIYTHFCNDLNIDHRITLQAVLTACRPQPNQSVKRIYSFEIPSSSEWAAHNTPPFSPNVFVDVSSIQKEFELALSCYEAELRDFPHSRSIQAIQALRTWRGACVGVFYAEAFMLERQIGLVS